uniref:DDE_Tnp_1_7 domain-containing protein n=1 Tax=Hymenolepis diminuta TaxID=6216 RepID=A0A0R3SH66_HYMDI
LTALNGIFDVIVNNTFRFLFDTTFAFLGEIVNIGQSPIFGEKLRRLHGFTRRNNVSPDRRNKINKIINRNAILIKIIEY